MTLDEIDISAPIAKHCPNCGTNDIVIFDSILLCHQCHRTFNAYEIRDELGE